MPYAREYGSLIVMALPSFVLVTFAALFMRNDEAPNLVMTASLIGAARCLQQLWRRKPEHYWGVYRLGINVSLVLGVAFSPNCLLLYLLPLIWDADGIWIAFAASGCIVAVIVVVWTAKIKKNQSNA